MGSFGVSVTTMEDVFLKTGQAGALVTAVDTDVVPADPGPAPQMEPAPETLGSDGDMLAGSLHNYIWSLRLKPLSRCFR